MLTVNSIQFLPSQNHQMLLSDVFSVVLLRAPAQSGSEENESQLGLGRWKQAEESTVSGKGR